MRLAFFDLDHTLLPIDSDFEWGQYIQRQGWVRVPDFAEHNAVFMAQYQNGSLDPDAYTRFVFSYLRAIDEAHGVETRQQLIQDYVSEVIAPSINTMAKDLVISHQKAGDICALTSATNTCITTPIAALFNLAVIGPSPELDKNGRITGALASPHNLGKNKVTNGEKWLQAQGLQWQDFSEVYAYSDSENDIPLLTKATHPVATNPSAKMLLHAQTQGWRTLYLY